MPLTKETTALAQVYNNFLARKGSETPISFEMQSRIFKHCLRRKDLVMLEKLAAYRHLDTRIDAEIGKRDDIKTLCVWASRPERTGQELESRLLADKRGAVVMHLAARCDLSTEAYVILAKIETQAVEEALAGNLAVPLEIRLAKIRKVAARAPRGEPYDHKKRLRSMCQGADETETRALYEAVAETALFMPYVKDCAQSYYMRQKDIDRFVDSIEAICLFDGTLFGDKWQPEYFNDFETLIETLLEHPICNAHDVANLGKLKRNIVSTKAKLIADEDNLGKLCVAKCERAIDGIDDELAALTGPFKALIAATVPTQAVEATIAARKVCTTKKEREQLAAQVAKHPQIPYTTGTQFVKWMSRTDIRLFLRKLEKEGNMEALIDLFCKTGSDSHMNEGMLSFIENPEILLDAVVAHVEKSGGMLPDWFILTSIVDTNLDCMINMLSWHQLARYSGRTPELNILFEKTILDALGGNAERWEAFNTLSEDYTESLSALLATVCKLSA